MIHSFFCVMGGLVLDLRLENLTTLTAQIERYTLTPQGVLRAVELGLQLPKLTKEAIKDRSKADSLAKSLACLQAGYMALQLIGRVATGLPVTELEVNIVAHVMCALIMFFFWMQKPLDVKDPVLVTGEWTQELGAFWSMPLRKLETSESSTSEALVITHLLEKLRLLYESSSVRNSEWLRERLGVPLDRSEKTDPGLQPVDRQIFELQVHDRWPMESEQWTFDDVILVLADVGLDELDDNIQGTLQQYEPWCKIATKIYYSSKPIDQYQLHQRPEMSEDSLPFELCLSINELPKWDLAWKGHIVDSSPSPFSPVISNNLVVRADNWSRESDHLHSRRAWLVTPAIALATALYGGLHLLLWRAYFPSTTERWLWRGSALIIAASGLTAVPFVLADTWGIDVDERTAGLAKRWLQPIVPKASRELLSKSSDISYYAVIGGVLVIYGAARIFLVLEAFISLRSLRIEVYQTPDWTQWIPHL